MSRPSPMEVAGARLRRIDAYGSKLVAPSTFALYEWKADQRHPYQIGSGFLLEFRGRTALVTSRHCLYGKHLSAPEMPGDKCIFAGGSLVRLRDLTLSECVNSDVHDVAMAFVTEFRHVMPEEALYLPHEAAPVIALYGYLARDFKRQGGVLKPKPCIVKQPSLGHEDGFLRFDYPRKNIDTSTDTPMFAPLPAGLSGGPILDAVALENGQLGLAGVFTEWGDGIGKGATRQVIKSGLDKLILRDQPST